MKILIKAKIFLMAVLLIATAVMLPHPPQPAEAQYQIQGLNCTGTSNFTTPGTDSLIIADDKVGCTATITVKGGGGGEGDYTGCPNNAGGSTGGDGGGTQFDFVPNATGTFEILVGGGGQGCGNGEAGGTGGGGDGAMGGASWGGGGGGGASAILFDDGSDELLAIAGGGGGSGQNWCGGGGNANGGDGGSLNNAGTGVTSSCGSTSPNPGNNNVGGAANPTPNRPGGAGGSSGGNGNAGTGGNSGSGGTGNATFSVSGGGGAGGNAAPGGGGGGGYGGGAGGSDDTSVGSRNTGGAGGGGYLNLSPTSGSVSNSSAVAGGAGSNNGNGGDGEVTIVWSGPGSGGTFSIEQDTNDDLVFTEAGGTPSGPAYCWGKDDVAQLGNGATTGNQNTPQLVEGGYTWTKVTAGEVHSCGLTDAGVGYCWGEGQDGRLGTGNTTDQNEPTIIAGGHTWIDIDAGWRVSCGIKDNGAAYCWGVDWNSVGTIGNNAGFGTYTSPELVSGGHTFVSVVAGDETNCAINDTDDAYCWGNGTAGQTGDGDFTEDHQPVLVSGSHKWSKVAPGWQHTCGITTAGVAYCWGNDTNGQLGNGATGASATPSAVDTGSLTGTKWVDIESGGDHSCGVRDSGDAYCWGTDSTGALGNGATTGDQTSPSLVSGSHNFVSISSGNDHSCAVTSAGDTYCWGLGTAGQNGNSSSTSQTSPVLVSGGYNWAQVNAGMVSEHSCGVVAENTGGNERARIKPSGRVVAQGGIQPGYDDATCNTSSEGVIRYYSASYNPTGCLTIGDLCSDGSYYIGQVGGNDTYATAAASETTLPWNNGNGTGLVNTGVASSTTAGETNTANLITVDSDSNTGGTQPHQAAQYCSDLVVHGNDSWYLPAQNELNLFWNGGTPVAGVLTNGTYYWSSTEANVSNVEIQRFDDGFQPTGNKPSPRALRCVSRNTGGSPVMQFCDGTAWRTFANAGASGGAPFTQTDNMGPSGSCTLGNWSHASGSVASGAGTPRDWTFSTAGTPSTDVGPTGDNDTGSDCYIFTEASSASGPVANDEFIIESNSINLDSYADMGIEFAWNKRCDTCANIYLELSTDGGSTWPTTLWSHLAQATGYVALAGSDTWNSECIDLSGYSGNIMMRFRNVQGSSGTAWHGDTGLDSIVISTSASCL